MQRGEETGAIAVLFRPVSAIRILLNFIRPNLDSPHLRTDVPFRPDAARKRAGLPAVLILMFRGAVIIVHNHLTPSGPSRTPRCVWAVPVALSSVPPIARTVFWLCRPVSEKAAGFLPDCPARYPARLANGRRRVTPARHRESSSSDPCTGCRRGGSRDTTPGLNDRPADCVSNVWITGR